MHLLYHQLLSVLENSQPNQIDLRFRNLAVISTIFIPILSLHLHLQNTKMHFYKFIAFFATVGFLEAKVIPGKCPAVSTMLDFDPTPVTIVDYLQGYSRFFLIIPLSSFQ